MASKHVEQYYRIQSLAEQLGSESAKVMAAYVTLQQEALASGALSNHIKQLMTLGIAISMRCDESIAMHVHNALQAGATRNEILETISVAILMAGAPAVAYGSEALEALNQF